MKVAGRLVWLCRRGTKELDVLLMRYLERHYPKAGPAEQRAFEALLELQDPQLQDYLSGHTEPSDPEARNVIQTLIGNRA